MAFSDDRMTFDDYSQRYYLTESAILNEGIDIRARCEEDTPLVIKKATTLVYNYAHDGVFDTALQDKVLADDEQVRKGLYRALIGMVESLVRYGNRQNAVEEGERAVAIPAEVKAEFDIIYPHLGHTLKYAGRW